MRMFNGRKALTRTGGCDAPQPTFVFMKGGKTAAEVKGANVPAIEQAISDLS
jgi:hypothetical protein